MKRRIQGGYASEATLVTVATAVTTLAGAIKAEDSGHTSGDDGFLMLAVRNDGGLALAGTDLDYIPLTTDATGALRGTFVEVAVAADGGALPAFVKVVAGYDGAAVQVLHTDVDGDAQVDLASSIPAGTNNIGDVDVLTEPATAADGGALPAVQKVIAGYDGANTQVIHTDVDGDLQIDVLSSALPTGAATSANQTNGSQLTQIHNAVSGFTANVDSTQRVWTFAFLGDSNGNGISSQVSGGKQPLDVGVVVSGVQIDPRDVTLASVPIDPRDIRALPGTDKIQIFGAATGLTAYVDTTLRVWTAAFLVDSVGNGISSQVSGTQRPLDVGVNVAGVQVDPRDVRVFTGTDKIQRVDGAGNVAPAGDVAARKVFVQPTDGTDNQDYTSAGEAKVSVTTQLGSSVVTTHRRDYSSSSVTTGAWVELVASLSAQVNKLDIFDSSGETLELGTGAAASETRLILVTPGGNGLLPVQIASGTRVSLRAVSATANTGEIVLNFLS
jgi:hypothetical protein